MTNNDFEFKYVATTNEEKKEIESIRSKYVKNDEKANKLQYLRKLDHKVNDTPFILSLSLGIIGILIFGLGLAMILEWNLLVWGIIVSAFGLVPVGLAYPVYLKVYKHLKNKYGEEIIKISDELLNI